MSRLLYIDAISGLAGDMLLGALLDAGADAGAIAGGLQGLGVDGLALRTERVLRHGIAATAVAVVAPDEPGDASHRSPAAIRALLDEAPLPARARERAQAVFAALAAAEARVHGVEPQQVQFHEVGALDSIGDVVGIALALESLDIGELACSPLPAPRGLIGSAHGRLPLPAPATLELLRGAPLYGVDLDVELVTPTGAAVVAALVRGFGPLPAMRLEAIGYGAGTRDLAERPNVTRVLTGEADADDATATGAGDLGRGEALLIETNLDDLSPELVPDAAERCFAAGALDVWVSSAQMKKGRPGIVLSALARPADERAVAQAILRETTALGVRVTPVRRWELERRSVTVEVDGEPVRVKLGILAGEPVNAAPEHDDCVAVARRHDRSVKEVWGAALAALAREPVP